MGVADDAESVARAWLDAVTRRDRAALHELSHSAIEIYGPNGVASGLAVMDAWFTSAPMRIEVKSATAKGEWVTVEHHIDWLDDAGDVEYSIDNTALVEVKDGRVASYRRVAG